MEHRHQCRRTLRPGAAQWVEPRIGAVGYTLGGGIGLLARRFGFAADHVRWCEIATADGRLRHVTPDSDLDLFWALRGAGANFGVVTAMEVDS